MLTLYFRNIPPFNDIFLIIFFYSYNISSLLRNKNIKNIYIYISSWSFTDFNKIIYIIKLKLYIIYIFKFNIYLKLFYIYIFHEALQVLIKLLQIIVNIFSESYVKVERIWSGLYLYYVCTYYIFTSISRLAHTWKLIHPALLKTALSYTFPRSLTSQVS